MSHLQPCPFCGADTRLSKYSKRIGKAAPRIFCTAQVKCKRNSCGMSGPLFKGDDASQRALRHWANCYFHPSMRRERSHTSAEAGQ